MLIGLAIACPSIAHAQPVAGPYVSLGGGVDILQNQNVKPDGIGPAARSYTFDPGGAAEASVGYGFGNGLRLEAEGDYADDHVHGVLIPAQYQGLRAGGYEQQYGAFGNLLYDFRLGLPVMPYLGVGAGFQEVELDHIASSAYGAVVGRAAPETRGNFAYQGIAGLSVKLPFRGLSLTLEYRLIGVLSPGAYYRGSVEEEVLLPGTGMVSRPGSYVPPSTFPRFETIRVAEHATFDNIFNHEILFGLRYAFNSAPPPPAPPTVEDPAPAPARTFLVFFDWDSAALTPRALDVVAQAAREAMLVRTAIIDVSGYADTSHALAGARGQHYNLRLSTHRADAVRSTLIRDGVPADAIDVHGYGDTHLLVSTVQTPASRRTAASRSTSTDGRPSRAVRRLV